MGKTFGGSSQGRKVKWEVNFRNFMETCCGDRSWMGLVQDRNQWLTLILVMLNLG